MSNDLHRKLDKETRRSSESESAAQPAPVRRWMDTVLNVAAQGAIGMLGVLGVVVVAAWLPDWSFGPIGYGLLWLIGMAFGLWLALMAIEYVGPYGRSLAPATLAGAIGIIVYYSSVPRLAGIFAVGLVYCSGLEFLKAAERK